VLHESYQGVYALSPTPVIRNNSGWILTDFPQAGPEFLILVEHPCELIAVVQHAHQPQEVLWGNRSIHFVVSQQIVRRFDEQELQHAFDDNLLEDPPAII
jgi:hypothetical protein